MEEVVEVPQILGPWSDSEQKSREQDEYTSSHGTDLRTPVHQRPARGGSLFHLLSLNLRLVTGFWTFRTQAPRTSNTLPNINLLPCLNGRILRLPITHLDEEMSPVISKLESCSKLLVIQRRALAESFAPA
jgi:hypothetical protein